MSGFNQVILLGRIGQDPETRYTQAGTPVTSISVATSRRRKDADGEFVEETAWHRVKAFGKQAEVIAEHFHQGDLIFIEGRIDYWEAKGERGKLMVAEIILEHFEFCGAKRGASGGDRPPSRPAPRGASRGATSGRGRVGDAPSSSEGPSGDLLDDDIPF